MKSSLRNKLNQKGQAAIEFILVVIVVFFFLLFYLSLTMVLVTSEYVDYATFMAARTFKTASSDRSFQEQYAREVFNKYMVKIGGIAKNPSMRIVYTNPNDEQTAGIVSNYQMDLFYMPPLFIKNGTQPASRITLSSEAHLGRDPTLNDCLNYFNNFSQQFGLGIEGTSLINEMDDNGC